MSEIPNRAPVFVSLPMPTRVLLPVDETRYAEALGIFRVLRSLQPEHAW